MPLLIWVIFITSAIEPIYVRHFRFQNGLNTVYLLHYSDVIMAAMASQIASVSSVYSTVCSGANQRKHQSSASLAFVRGLHRWSMNSPRKGSATRKMFLLYDVHDLRCFSDWSKHVLPLGYCIIIWQALALLLKCRVLIEIIRIYRDRVLILHVECTSYMLFGLLTERSISVSRHWKIRFRLE